MRKFEIELLYKYFYNNRVRYENDVRQLQQNIRYRHIDVVDCFELACAIERLETFIQTSSDVMQLLKMRYRCDSDSESEEE